MAIFAGTASEPADTAVSAVEDPQGPQSVIASEDSSQPLLAAGTPAEAVVTPDAEEVLAQTVEAPAQEMAEAVLEQPLGGLPTSSPQSLAS